jgi:hypothetical protein
MSKPEEIGVIPEKSGFPPEFDLLLRATINTTTANVAITATPAALAPTAIGITFPLALLNLVVKKQNR